MKKYYFASLVALFIMIGGFVSAPSHAFTLHNFQTGLCLGVAGASASPGTGFVTWTCDQTNQDRSQQFGQIEVLCPANTPCNVLSCDQSQWYYCSYVIPSYFQSESSNILFDNLTNVACEPNPSPGEGEHCGSYTNLGVYHDTIRNGSPIVQQNNTNNFDQRWIAVPAVTDYYGHTCYYFENVASFQSGQTYVMGVSGGNPKRGTAIILWQLFTDAYGNPDFRGHPDQFWCVY